MDDFIHDDSENPLNFDQKDPFNEFNNDDDLKKELDIKIHLRIQKRNARKSVTTVAGLNHYDHIKPKKLMSLLRKKLCCNGHQTKDSEGLPIIQVQGDHRDQITQILTKEFNIKSKNIVKHGF